MKRGRSDEFRELVTRHQGSALTLAYRVLGKWDDAEDAAQDAFVRAFRSIRTFSEGAVFWPWFRKILVNCCLRRIPREVPAEDIEALMECSRPFVDSPEGEILKQCELGELKAAISGLPPDYRSVIVLRYQEDFSTSEIAESLDLSAGAVRVRLHRALRMLADRLVVTENEVQ